MLGFVFSEIVVDFLSHLPKLPEPADYHRGVDEARPIHSRNVIVFERTSPRSLQQRNFANRSHHRHVLILSLETAGTVLLDGVSLRLHPGEAVLVRPFQFHHYSDLDSSRLRWLFVSFELEKEISSLDLLRFRVWRPSPPARHLFGEVVRLWLDPESPSRPGELLATVDRLLHRFAGETAGRVPVDASSNPSWTERAEAALRESVEETETVAAAARSIGMSPRNFQSRFRRETGVGPREYRANYRLHRAVALLRGSDLSIGEVAAQVGFTSQAAFNRFIRRETGATPGVLRRSVRA